MHKHQRIHHIHVHVTRRPFPMLRPDTCRASHPGGAPRLRPSPPARLAPHTRVPGSRRGTNLQSCMRRKRALAWQHARVPVHPSPTRPAPGTSATPSAVRRAAPPARRAPVGTARHRARERDRSIHPTARHPPRSRLTSFTPTDATVFSQCPIDRDGPGAGDFPVPCYS